MDQQKPATQIHSERSTSISGETRKTAESLFNHVEEFLLDQPDNITSISEVEHMARSRIAAVSKEWACLRTILATHQQILCKRWNKKNLDQRKRIFQASWPDIPPMHRPDLHVLRCMDRRSYRDPNLRDHFLLPYLNIEDLAKSRILPLLLDSRGRHKPEQHAVLDFQSVQIGIAFKAISLLKCPTRFMLVSTHTVSQHYGSMVGPTPERPVDFVAFLADGMAMNSGSGLLVLEIQTRILSFLNKCAKHILHDLSLNPLSDQALTFPSCSDGYHAKNEDHTWVTIKLEAPYRLADQYDFNRLCTYVQAKRAEAEDNLWALREDPGYFEDVLCAAEEQARIALKERQVSPRRSSWVWKAALSQSLWTAHLRLWLFDHTYQDLTELLRLTERYDHGIIKEKRLPRDWKDALAYFSRSIQDSLELLLDLILFAFVSDPKLQRYMAFNHKERAVFVRAKTRDDRLLWLLDELRIIRDTSFFVGLSVIMNEIEILIDQDPEQGRRLSPMALGLISDIGLLGEIWRQISLSWPEMAVYPSVRDSMLETRSNQREADFMKIAKPLLDIAGSARISVPSEKLLYPSDVRRTATVTSQMQKAERELDLFWEKFDECFLDETGENTQSLLPENTMSRHLRRTSDWNKGETHDDHERALFDGSLMISNFDNIAARTEGAPSPSVSLLPRLKLKTRGVAAPTVCSDFDQLSQVDPITKLEFKVGQRSFKVFASLFHTPTEDGVPGDLPWNDFLHAMTSIGFSAQKLHGSAWYFSPPDQGRSITFHEPHPASKVPFCWVRRFGRRLNRAYGWTKDTFVKA